MRLRMKFLYGFLTVLLLTGCGASSASKEMAVEEYTYGMEAPAENEATADMTVPEAGVGEISEIPQNGRKLIRTFDMMIETKEFDTVLSGVQDKVQELGGYMENSSLDSGSAYYSNYNRSAYMTARIPSDQVNGFLKNVKETANVTNISESTEDITLRYVDTESRKNALETERDRLLELLEKAGTVEEIITIESRLSDVRYQLESYASQLRTLDNQVDYSTVTIQIHEVERETQPTEKTFREEVSGRFGDSLYGIGQGIREFAVWILGSSPYLLLWAVIIAAVVFVLKTVRKKKNLKRMLQTTKTEETASKEEKEN